MVESIALGSFVSDTCDFPLPTKGAAGLREPFTPPGFCLLAVTGPLVYVFRVRMVSRGLGWIR